MHTVIHGQIGRVHHANQHPALRKTRPVYCWIPEAFFDGAGLNRSRYLSSRWPCINAGANPLALGSHVIPDPEKPVSIRSKCPILREYLARLEHIATVKTSSTAA